MLQYYFYFLFTLKPAFCCHSEEIFLILRTTVQQQQIIYIVIDYLPKSDGDVIKTFFVLSSTASAHDWARSLER